MNSDDSDAKCGKADGSRRDVLQRMGAGLVAAPLLMAGTGAGAQTQPAPATPARRLTDPREKFPKPPFAPQQQERPGSRRA